MLQTIQNTETDAPISTVQDVPQLDPAEAVLAELDTYPTTQAFRLFEGDVFAKVVDDALHIFKAVVVSHAGVTVEGHRKLIRFCDLGRVTLLERNGKSAQHTDTYGRPVEESRAMAEALLTTV